MTRFKRFIRATGRGARATGRGIKKAYTVSKPIVKGAGRKIKKFQKGAAKKSKKFDRALYPQTPDFKLDFNI